jgi:signal transduction histidine kinase
LPTASVLYEALLGLFLVYSILLALRVNPHSGLLGLLALFADAVYFMVIAIRGDSLIWFASLVFLYLLVEAVAMFSPVEVALVAGVSAAFCAVLPIGGQHELERTIVVSGVFAWGCALGRRRQSGEIENLREALETAKIAAEKAREDEAKRIAADFHDGPLQSFISLQMRLEILRKLLERDFNAGMEDLRQLQALAQDQIRDLRAFLHSMRPVDVDGGNMIANARRTAESFQKETGIPVTFMGANSPVGLPQELTLEVLQMIREALHNVQKHAGATRVAVAMEKTERGLEISIDDNGHGFPFAGSYSLEELELLRLGPASLKRRARSLNADLLLESRPGRGAGLKFRVPLQ